jgi:hypothetical protein
MVGGGKDEGTVEMSARIEWEKILSITDVMTV